MRDNGLLLICRLENTAPKGQMPVEKLVVSDSAFYSERTVGYERHYAAMGAKSKIDKLVRCWHTAPPEEGTYVILEDGKQYRVTFAQDVTDEEAADLTLERLGTLYEVIKPDT